MRYFRVAGLVRAGSLAIAMAAAAQPGFGFGTINSAGQNAEHEKITRLGLFGLGIESKTLSEIAGRRGSFGAVGAPDHPANGLVFHADAHCDGGDWLPIDNYPHPRAEAREALESCRTWILDHMRKAVRDAGGLLDGDGRVKDKEIPTWISCTYSGQSGRAKCNVMEALGRAFHASQDFYSHTNWTDVTPPGVNSVHVPRGLAQGRPAPWINFPLAPEFPDGLISGCFKAKPETLFCKGRVKHQTLNKDHGAFDMQARRVLGGTTERSFGNSNFRNAANAAITDTRKKWRWFEAEVLREYGGTRGKRIICAMKTDDAAKHCN